MDELIQQARQSMAHIHDQLEESEDKFKREASEGSFAATLHHAAGSPTLPTHQLEPSSPQRAARNASAVSELHQTSLGQAAHVLQAHKSAVSSNAAVPLLTFVGGLYFMSLIWIMDRFCGMFGIFDGPNGRESLDKKMKLWEKYKDDASPDVFSHLTLAHDGGFSEVRELYDPSRWLSAAVMALFILYNVYYLTALDVSFMSSPESAVKALGGAPETVLTPFYISQTIVAGILYLFTGDSTLPIQPVVIIGALELAGLAYYLLLTAHCCMVMRLHPGYRRWWAVQMVFWEICPILSMYSSMRMLNHVVPQVMSNRATELITDIQEARKEGRRLAQPLLRVVGWVLMVTFAFILGFDTFLMKLRVVSVVAISPQLTLWAMGPCLQFLVQVLGVVQLGPFVRKRLFIFIFGGEDGILQDSEKELMDCWNALLARRIFETHSFRRFMVVMFSFSDEDFQKLVLNEGEEQQRRQEQLKTAQATMATRDADASRDGASRDGASRDGFSRDSRDQSQEVSSRDASGRARLLAMGQQRFDL